MEDFNRAENTVVLLLQTVRYNRDKVHEVADRILSICKEPVCFERILQKVFKGYGLAMNFEQYVLVGSTVRSCLSSHSYVGH